MGTPYNCIVAKPKDRLGGFVWHWTWLSLPSTGNILKPRGVFPLQISGISKETQGETNSRAGGWVNSTGSKSNKHKESPSGPAWPTPGLGGGTTHGGAEVFTCKKAWRAWSVRGVSSSAGLAKPYKGPVWEAWKVAPTHRWANQGSEKSSRRSHSWSGAKQGFKPLWDSTAGCSLVTTTTNTACEFTVCTVLSCIWFHLMLMSTSWSWRRGFHFIGEKIKSQRNTISITHCVMGGWTVMWNLSRGVSGNPDPSMTPQSSALYPSCH